MRITFRNLMPLKARTLLFTLACLALIAFGLTSRLMTDRVEAALDRAMSSERGGETAEH